VFSWWCKVFVNRQQSSLTGASRVLYELEIVNVTSIHGDVRAHVSAECLRLDGLCGGLVDGEPNRRGAGSKVQLRLYFNLCSRDFPPAPDGQRNSVISYELANKERAPLHSYYLRLVGELMCPFALKTGQMGQTKGSQRSRVK
jgi:hypothetical protein